MKVSAPGKLAESLLDPKPTSRRLLLEPNKMYYLMSSQTQIINISSVEKETSWWSYFFSSFIILFETN